MCLSTLLALLGRADAVGGPRTQVRLNWINYMNDHMYVEVMVADTERGTVIRVKQVVKCGGWQLNKRVWHVRVASLTVHSGQTRTVKLGLIVHLSLTIKVA